MPHESARGWGSDPASLNPGISRPLIVLILAILLPHYSTAPLAGPSIIQEQGQVTEAEDEYGTFYSYIPVNLPAEPEILVLIHSTPAKNDRAEFTAQYYIANWVGFAEEHGFILITPVFNQENFSSRQGDHAMGGYRGLFGREIGADEWVLRLVRAQQQAFGVRDDRFYLYGHSAGGQFVARFLVMHPEIVKRAVITAAATYPQPEAETAWPFGMGELHSEIEWDADTIKQVDLYPDKQKWLEATQIPLTVIVGLNDTAEVPVYPGQNGKNRLQISRNWVLNMADFARENGLKSCFQFEIFPAKGQSMNRLLSLSQEALVPKSERSFICLLSTTAPLHATLCPCS